MRSAHIFYRAMTNMADTYEGTDGILIISPFNEFMEHIALGGVAVLLTLLVALTAAC